MRRLVTTLTTTELCRQWRSEHPQVAWSCIIEYELGGLMELVKKPRIKKTFLKGRPVYVAISQEKIAVFHRPETARDWLMRHTIVR